MRTYQRREEIEWGERGWQDTIVCKLVLVEPPCLRRNLQTKIRLVISTFHIFAAPGLPYLFCLLVLSFSSRCHPNIWPSGFRLILLQPTLHMISRFLTFLWRDHLLPSPLFKIRAFSTSGNVDWNRLSHWRNTSSSHQLTHATCKQVSSLLPEALSLPTVQISLAQPF